MTAFAFVFPGQGSQSVGMLSAWGDHPAVRATLEEASAALGEDVARLIGEGPKEALDLTTNTQPVMLTAGIANYRAWLAEGGAAPAIVAGHSLGEYTALAAVQVAKRRGHGRHPGLLIIDSPGAEEVVSADLEQMLDSVAAAAEEIGGIQIIIGTIARRAVEDVVPDTHRLQARGDGYLF